MASILKIGKRLATVVDLCPSCEVVADIGCDHGYVSCELVLENKARMVIATDKSEQCLMKAVSLADQINILPFLSFRVGDGFGPITKHDKIGCAIIAGMGGLEIIEILKHKPKKLYNFVLQPQNNVLELRHYLIDNGFKIETDKLVYDDKKFYNVLKVTKGKNKLADIEVFFGKSNFKENSKVFKAYLIERKNDLTRLMAQAGGLAQKSRQELAFVNQALAMCGEDQQEDISNQQTQIGDANIEQNFATEYIAENQQNDENLDFEEHQQQDENVDKTGNVTENLTELAEEKQDNVEQANGQVDLQNNGAELNFEERNFTESQNTENVESTQSNNANFDSQVGVQQDVNTITDGLQNAESQSQTTDGQAQDMQASAEKSQDDLKENDSQIFDENVQKEYSQIENDDELDNLERELEGNVGSKKDKN